MNFINIVSCISFVYMADIITLAVSYNRHSELDKYRHLCCITDIIINLAIFYSRYSELDQYRQLCCIADIIITLLLPTF